MASPSRAYQIAILAHLSVLPFYNAYKSPCPAGFNISAIWLRPFLVRHFTNFPFCKLIHCSAHVSFTILPSVSIFALSVLTFSPFPAPVGLSVFHFYQFYHFSAWRLRHFFHPHRSPALLVWTFYHSVFTYLFYHFPIYHFTYSTILSRLLVLPFYRPHAFRPCRF